MKKLLKELYIKLGNHFLTFDERLHIQELDNGFLFIKRYYKNIEEMMPDIEKEIKRIFDITL